jgi:hypothetical protein
MLARVEYLAELSVARGCGFAALAILTLMVGLSWDAALACRLGGVLVLLVCALLLLKAWRAPYRPIPQDGAMADARSRQPPQRRRCTTHYEPGPAGMLPALRTVCRGCQRRPPRCVLRALVFAADMSRQAGKRRCDEDTDARRLREPYAKPSQIYWVPLPCCN